ncbi:hypothetical protein HC928_18920 [bacterium]|nr:hypothetical protein [bacterium]
MRLLEHNGVRVEVLRGREPVDVIFVDRATSPVTLFFAEIKASPLVTLPLAVKTETITDMEGEISSMSHRETDLIPLFHQNLHVFLPIPDDTHGWRPMLFPLGRKISAEDKSWAYRGLEDLLDDAVFFPVYLSFWRSALDAYQSRMTDLPIYWLTNGCGQPVPRPQEWPIRPGTGYESVSDAKPALGWIAQTTSKKQPIRC